MSAAAGVDVRRATPADAVPLAEVHTQCWQQTYRGLMSDAFLAALRPADRLAMWCQLLLAPEPAAWVACVDGSVVGFSATCAVPQGDLDQNLPASGSLELWGLYLLKSHQGLGLGRRLLEGQSVQGPPVSGWPRAMPRPSDSTNGWDSLLTVPRTAWPIGKTFAK